MSLGWFPLVPPLGTGRSLLQFVGDLGWLKIVDPPENSGSPRNKSESSLFPSRQLRLRFLSLAGQGGEGREGFVEAVVRSERWRCWQLRLT
jgi:hypothetical protein